jgi:hypothetical protein
VKIVVDALALILERTAMSSTGAEMKALLSLGTSTGRTFIASLVEQLPLPKHVIVQLFLLLLVI